MGCRLSPFDVRWLLVTLPAVLTVAGSVTACGVSPAGETPSPAGMAPAGASDQIIADAFATRAHSAQVEGKGTVVRVLEDDKDGSRHQRFIVRLDSGQTLLIAHNIDLAPRVRGLRVRDTVAFFGEYEWSEEGGTIHWTHHDPENDHVDGWLQHRGRVYR